MAVRTVAPAGGNFTTPATWVGGVAPINNDSIIANSSSGNLTLTVSTVNLQSADFTGYTGTLALGSFNMIFNSSPANGTITLSPSMTITRNLSPNGTIRVSVATTIISNGKSIPFSMVSTGTTVTLSDDLTLDLVNNWGTNNIITGNRNLIITDPVPSGPSSLIIAPGSKLIYRPTGGNLSFNSGRLVGSGYFQFDVSGSITVSSITGFYIGTQTARNTATTVEFLQNPATWTGAGTINNRPIFNYDTYNTNYTGLTTSLIMATNSRIEKFVCDGGFNNNIGLSIQNTLIIDELYFKSSSGNATYNIVGSGGFSASNVVVNTNKSTINLQNNGTIARFSADAQYIIGSLSVSGSIGNSPSCVFSSLTSSVPTTMNISNGGFAYAQITDINNTGTGLYALSANGNILTRTTGFIGSVSAGGAGGSFTFVN